MRGRVRGRALWARRAPQWAATTATTHQVADGECLDDAAGGGGGAVPDPAELLDDEAQTRGGDRVGGHSGAGAEGRARKVVRVRTHFRPRALGDRGSGDWMKGGVPADSSLNMESPKAVSNTPVTAAVAEASVMSTVFNFATNTIGAGASASPLRVARPRPSGPSPPLWLHCVHVAGALGDARGSRRDAHRLVPRHHLPHRPHRPGPSPPSSPKRTALPRDCASLLASLSQGFCRWRGRCGRAVRFRACWRWC